MDRPEVMANVMITFEKTFSRGPYGIEKYKSIVTKRGFLTDSDGFYDATDKWIATPNGYWAVPPEWRPFKGVLAPHGWGGDRLYDADVIKWEYCEN